MKTGSYRYGLLTIGAAAVICGVVARGRSPKDDCRAPLVKTRGAAADVVDGGGEWPLLGGMPMSATGRIPAKRIAMRQVKTVASRKPEMRVYYIVFKENFQKR